MHSKSFSPLYQATLVLFAALAASSLLSGCGSGGSTSATTPPVAGPTGAVAWSYNSDPVPAQITGGPWTLTQLAGGNASVKANAPYLASGSGVNVSWNYCDAGGKLVSNTVATPVNMQPYYFPHVWGDGQNLQGLFDYRPKDLNEAIVAATSVDGGKTWTFKQQAFMRWPGTCPLYDPATKAVKAATATTYTNQWGDDGTKAPTVSILDGDAGYGHPNHITINGVTRMYMLDRDYRTSISNPAALTSAIDNLGLITYPLSTAASGPLTGLQSSASVQDGGGNYFTYTPSRTTGLYNPDGIMAVLRGTSPTTILYVSKIKGGDNTGPTTMPPSQQCSTQPYPATGTNAPKSPNHDLVTIRIAATTDGVNFVDGGAVTGLNDPTTTDYSKLRYVAPNGTLIDLGAGHYGLIYAGGNCMDADSDAFHIIGYAENTTPYSLKDWKVINGIDNPIASIETKTFVNAGTGKSETHPANPPIVGTTKSWYAGRVYSPSATRVDDHTLALTFSGYGVQSPNTDLLNYRQIGNVVLKSSQTIPVQQQ